MSQIKSPSGYVAQPAEIAAAIIFRASDAAVSHRSGS